MNDANFPSNLDFHNLVAHFLALSARDRLLRFGRLLCAADICEYVDSMLLDSQSALILRETNRDIAGEMHLEAEGGDFVLGLSVASWARGQGIGTMLMYRAIRLARSRDSNIVFVRKLGCNHDLRRLAGRMGLNVAWTPDRGSAQLELPLDKEGPMPGRRDEDRMMLADICMRADGEERTQVAGIPFATSGFRELATQRQ